MDDPQEEGNPDKGMEEPPVSRHYTTKHYPCKSDIDEDQGRPPCIGKNYLKRTQPRKEYQGIHQPDCQQNRVKSDQDEACYGKQMVNRQK